MTKQKEQALVVSQEQLADGIFSMWIQTKAAETAKPGQFISMYTNDGSKLLPRPISICEIDKENGRLRVVYRVTGPKTGTEEFSKLKAGDIIPVIGPLGNGFPKKEKKAFYNILFPMMEQNMQRLSDDLDWFCDKFDYRNKDADWRTSKDALPRGMQKVAGGYPADEPYTMDK